MEIGKLPIYLGEIDTAKLIHEIGGWSMAEAKRLVLQGAVEIDEEKVGRTNSLYNGSVVKVGKRFLRKIDAGINMEYKKRGNKVKILNIKSG